MSFDKQYWESHWQNADANTAAPGIPNPYLISQTAALTPGTALDAGCGEGAEAAWLAQQGWRVTAADISAEVLARARSRTSEPIDWVEADLATWTPPRVFDLVTTHYAHPDIPQLDFYERIAQWVAPGGTLLIVGHGHGGHKHGGHEHGAQPAAVTAASVAAVLDATRWRIDTAAELSRTLATRNGHSVELNDVIVRATLNLVA